MVVAETEAAAEDGAELVSVEYEPLEAVIDLEAAMEPGACLARRVEEEPTAAISSRSTPAPTTDDRTRSRSSSPATSSIKFTDHGDAAAAIAARRRRRLGDIPDAVGLSGLHRAAGGDRVARARRHSSSRSRPRAPSSAVQSSPARTACRSRDRILAEPLGGAFGGKFALVERSPAAQHSPYAGRSAWS